MAERSGAPRRLVRRTQEKLIWGVASGLADYFGVDPIWFRLGFVLTIFAGGAGLLAYLVLAAIMPTDVGTGPTPAERAIERVAHSMQRRPAWVGLALLIVGALLLLDQIAGWPDGVLWGIGLIAIGLVLFRHADQVPEITSRNETVRPDSTAVASGAPATESLPAQDAQAPRAPALTRVHRKPRERSMLGWITTGAVLVALGVTASMDSADVVAPSFTQYVALVMTIFGLGLLVSAWWGRARWLAMPCLFLMPVLLVSTAVKVPLEGGFRVIDVRPATANELQPTYRIVGGEVRIDLTNLKKLTESRTIKVTVAGGRIFVLIPKERSFTVHARVGIGEVQVLGSSDGGTDVEVNRVIAAAGANSRAPHLTLDLETSLGSVEVVEAEMPVEGES